MNVQSRKLALASGLALAMAALSGAIVLSTAQAQVSTTNPGVSPNPPSALPTPGSAGTWFGNYDVNADGKLSQDELKRDANLMDRARSLDTNKDGYLSLEEYSAPGATSVTPPR